MGYEIFQNARLETACFEMAIQVTVASGQTISNSHVNIVILLSNLWSWVGGNVAKDIHDKHTYNT